MAGGICGGHMWQGGHGRGGGHVWWGSCMVVVYAWQGSAMQQGVPGRGVCGRRNSHCSGWYASYWNAFLLRNMFHSILSVFYIPFHSLYKIGVFPKWNRNSVNSANLINHLSVN